MKENNFIISFAWKFMERFSVQIASFTTTLVLARLLTTQEYGTVALVTVFIELATVFVQGGFNTALIQKSNIDDEDVSTVFLFSISIALICYALIYLSAPFISLFYNNEIIIPVIRVIAISLFPGAFNSVQVAIATRNLEFKKIFKASLIGSLTAAFLGITMAILGFGIWAMVAWQLVNITMTSIFMWITIKWRPILVFSIDKFKSLIPFGSRILLSNFIVTLFQNVRSLLIGGIYTASDLAFFNRGKQFPQVLMDGVVGSMQSVSLPVFSKMQNGDKKIYKENIRKIVTTSYFIVFPLLVGIAAIAKPLVLLLLTDKWIEAVQYIKIFAFTYMVQPTQIVCAEALKALGLSNVTLRLEFFRKGFEIGLLLLTIKLGPQAIALSALLAGILAIIVSIYPNVKYLNYKVSEQLFDIAGPLFASIIMGAVVVFLGKLQLNIILILALQVLLGAIIYVLLCWLFNIKALKFLLNSNRNK